MSPLWTGVEWRSFGAGISGVVVRIATRPDGGLVAAGTFNYAGDTPVTNIAQFSRATWTSMGAGLNIGVSDLAVLPSGDVIAAGNFTMSEPIRWAHIGRGTPTWPSCSVWTRASSRRRRANGDRSSGGNFTIAGGVPGRIRTVERVELVAPWPGIAPTGPTAQPLLALPNGDLIVGGFFNMAGGHSISNLARWDWAGSEQYIGRLPDKCRCDAVLPNAQENWRSRRERVLHGRPGGRGRESHRPLALGCGVALGVGSGIVTSATYFRKRWRASRRSVGDLIAGGYFTSADGQPVPHLARWDGSAWHALGGGVDSSVFSIASVPLGDTYGGGDFSFAGGEGSRCAALPASAHGAATGQRLRPVRRAVCIGGTTTIVVAATGETPTEYRCAAR